ncbi:MAG: HNH endonuclease [Hyphomicrobiales bacterium]|nr:HNH endonuclease [Hyphomicrobiales bacterium]MDE2115905.1 HNH endonuclease [Hyphomicrobiales bacterium]
MLNNFSAVEQGKKLLMSDRESIVQKIIKNIPSIIIVFSKKRFEKNIGFDRVDLSNIYMPVYSFVYVSSGGNSSAKADFIFNVENLNKIVSYLGSLIKFRASVYGQRLLMTSHLRERIKRRDSYTCKTCGISTSDEKNLLLEIDHKIPLSKGGITSEENLQTLCWKCNRSKGAKILTKIS